MKGKTFKTKNVKKGLEKELRGTDDLISPVDEKQCIVIDIGSFYTRVGFSGFENPSMIIPTCVAFPNENKDTQYAPTKRLKKFGAEALKKSKESEKEYNLRYPIQRSCLLDNNQADHDHIEMFLKDIFENQLRVDPSHEDVMIIDSPGHDKEYRKKIAELMFEKLKVNSLNFMNSGVVSLFASGRTQGLSIDIGHGRTNLVPVFSGYPLYHASHSIKNGGADSNEYLEKRVMDLLANCKTPFTFENVGMEKNTLLMEIKEKTSCVALNYDAALKGDNNDDLEQRAYVLPDGETVLFVDPETRYKTGEILMRPPIKDAAKIPSDLEKLGIADDNKIDLVENIFDSLVRTDHQLREQLWSNIVLSGGGSLCRGLPQRLTRDLNNLSPASFGSPNYKVQFSKGRENLAWVGGSMLASIKTFQDLFILKSEYETNTNPEHRVSLIKQKTV